MGKKKNQFSERLQKAPGIFLCSNWEDGIMKLPGKWQKKAEKKLNKVLCENLRNESL